VNSRTNRLAKELLGMRQLKEEAALIDFSASGEAADSYVVTFRCKGLTLDAAGKPRIAEEHRIKISLTAGYPKWGNAPVVEQITPIFHPNFQPPPKTGVCTDTWKWTPAETVADLVLRLFNMVRYQLYNLGDPWNQKAVAWVEANRSKLPMDGRSWAKAAGEEMPLAKVASAPKPPEDDFQVRVVKK